MAGRSSPVNLPVDDGAIPSPVDSRIAEIRKKMQDFIERINQNRAMDQTILKNYEERLMRKVLFTSQRNPSQSEIQFRG